MGEAKISIPEGASAAERGIAAILTDAHVLSNDIEKGLHPEIQALEFEMLKAAISHYRGLPQDHWLRENFGGLGDVLKIYWGISQYYNGRRGERYSSASAESASRGQLCKGDGI